MSENPGGWLLAIVGGGVVAALYFAGLWWTVQRVTHARNPALLVLASYLTRTAIAAAALIVVADSDPLRVLAALAGFLIIRVVLVRSVRTAGFAPSAAGAHARER